jgi:hypothetical protein
MMTVLSTTARDALADDEFIPTPAGCDSRGYARLGVSDSMG